MSIVTGGLAFRNQKMIDYAEHWDQFIMNRSRMHPDIWFDRVPKGPLSNYDGLVRKTNIFHGGLGEQAGLTNWKQIMTSRKPEGTDPGYDACSYNPRTFTYAWETKQFTGFESSWQSEPICIKDVRWVAEGRQQLILLSSFLGQLTQSVWSNLNHEKYVEFSVLAGNAHILTTQGPEYSSDPTVRYYYDPYAEDSNGNTYIYFPASMDLSTLNWSYLDWWQDYLGDACPEAAIANDSGMPSFGLIAHKRDVDNMLMNDSSIREDIRYAMPKMLIDDYRSVNAWKGWPLIHDLRQMRFKIEKYVTNPTYRGATLTGTFIKAIRVKPRREGAAVTIGNRPETNPDYVNAELAIAPIFMNGIIQNLIPNAIADAGGGHVFGASPSYNGEFNWINEYDREFNIKRETGYFFANFESFMKPLMYANEAHSMLYSRCPQRYNSTCAQLGPDDIAATSEAVGIASDAVTADVDSTNYTVKLTLSKRLAGGVNEAVTVTDDSGVTYNGYIAQANAEPTYVFILTSLPPAYTEFTAAGSCTVVLA